MTVLSAAQSALIRLVGRKPSTVFSSTEQTVVEVADLVTEVATDIMKSHDWQALTKFHTINGDGVTAAFDKPDDYDRMALAQGISDNQSWFWGYSQVPDLTLWTQIKNGFYLGVATPGWWMLLGNQFQFLPAPGADAVASFPYISSHFARSGTGVSKAEFGNDDDTFVLEDRLLTLGLIWRWRAQKRLEYSEDLQTYEIALSQAQARDGGSRVIRNNGSRLPSGTVLAWPWELGQEVP